MTTQQIITSEGIVAIIRSPDESTARRLGRSLLASGLRVVEVSLVTPGALAVIETLAAEAGPGVVIGVGTAMTRAHVADAVSAGARFVVSPTTHRDVISRAVELGVVSLPGAATPTEIAQAIDWGAQFVKIFPASLWTPASLKEMLAAMPSVAAVPTGGVTAHSTPSWIAAGAAAVGIGSALTSSPDLHSAVVELRSAITNARASTPPRPQVV